LNKICITVNSLNVKLKFASPEPTQIHLSIWEFFTRKLNFLLMPKIFLRSWIYLILNNWITFQKGSRNSDELISQQDLSSFAKQRSDISKWLNKEFLWFQNFRSRFSSFFIVKIEIVVLKESSKNPFLSYKCLSLLYYWHKKANVHPISNPIVMSERNSIRGWSENGTSK